MESFSFLAVLRQNQAFTQELYNSPAVVFSVYRAVTSLSRHLIHRLSSQPVKQTMVKLWAKDKQHVPNIIQAYDQLQKLHMIFKETKITEGQSTFYVSIVHNFRETLKTVFTNGVCKLLIDGGKRVKDVREWWPGYTKLYDLISQPSLSGQRSIQSKNIREVLRRSKLMPEGDKQITCEGFQFILSSTKYQVNKFLISYTQQIVKNASTLGNKTRLIAFIVSLSLLPTQKCFFLKLSNGSSLLKQQLQIIQDLQEIGFCWKQGNKVGITDLFSNFCFDEPKAKLDIQCDIIVQTNFRVYAQMKQSVDAGARFMRQLLKKFIQVQDYRFQNMIVGTITEDQIRKALKKGISADSIIQFFKQNTSNKRSQNQKDKGQIQDNMDLKGKLHFLKLDQQDADCKVPTNVCQQIKLWQELKSDFTNRFQFDQQQSY